MTLGPALRRIVGGIYDHLPLKPPVMRLLRPFQIPHSVYQHLHFHGTIDVAVPGGTFKMQHVAEEIENELFWEGLPGRREHVSMSLWMRLCPTARVIVDVGANSGVYALVAAALNPAARVFAYEPLPVEHEKLLRNVALNGFRIVSPRVALSDAAGVAKMDGWAIGAGSAGSVEVPTARLDALLSEAGVGHVDLMKIDVEGHEPAVLRGMGTLLAASRPTLLIEVLSEDAAQQLRPLLAGLGYLYYDLDEVSPPRPVPEIRKSSHWNLLACGPETAEKLGLPRA